MRLIFLTIFALLNACIALVAGANVHYQHNFQAAPNGFKKLSVPAGDIVTLQFISFGANADYFCQLQASSHTFTTVEKEIAFGDFENYAIHFEREAGFISVETRASEKGNTMVTLVLQNHGNKAQSMQINCQGRGVSGGSAPSIGTVPAVPDDNAFSMPIPSVLARKSLVNPNQEEPKASALQAVRIKIRNTLAYEISIDIHVEHMLTSGMGKPKYDVIKKDSIAPFTEDNVELPMAVNEYLSLKIRARIHDENVGEDFNQQSVSHSIRSADMAYELSFDENGKMVFAYE